MNGIAVYWREADSRSLSRQSLQLASAPKVHTQPIPLTTARFNDSRFNDSQMLDEHFPHLPNPNIPRSLVPLNTTYYHLIRPNTGHKKSRFAQPTLNNPSQSKKGQPASSHINVNQAKSSFSFSSSLPPTPATITTIMNNVLTKGKQSLTTTNKGIYFFRKNTGLTCNIFNMRHLSNFFSPSPSIILSFPYVPFSAATGLTPVPGLLRSPAKPNH
jgi:hypothetical protein